VRFESAQDKRFRSRKVKYEAQVMKESSTTPNAFSGYAHGNWKIQLITSDKALAFAHFS